MGYKSMVKKFDKMFIPIILNQDIFLSFTGDFMLSSLWSDADLSVTGVDDLSF